MCTKGPISGPQVKVAAELVRPLGLWCVRIKGYNILERTVILINLSALLAVWNICWISRPADPYIVSPRLPWLLLILAPSYVISFTGTMSLLYWIGAQANSSNEDGFSSFYNILKQCCKMSDIIGRSRRQRFPDHTFMPHCTFSPTSWTSRGSVAYQKVRERLLAAFNVTLLILVLEIPFNF